MSTEIPSDSLHVSRRSLLAGIPVAALFLAGCATTPSTTTTSTAVAPTGAPAAAGSVAAALWSMAAVLAIRAARRRAASSHPTATAELVSEAS